MCRRIQLSCIDFDERRQDDRGWNNDSKTSLLQFPMIENTLHFRLLPLPWIPYTFVSAFPLIHLFQSSSSEYYSSSFFRWVKKHPVCFLPCWKIKSFLSPHLHKVTFLFKAISNCLLCRCTMNELFTNQTSNNVWKLKNASRIMHD